MGVAGVDIVASRHAASVHVELGAVGEGVFHRVIVEVLVHGSAAIMPGADGLGLDWPGILHPAQMVDVMNVKVAEAPAARPNKAMEPLNLPEQFAGFARPFFRKDRSPRPMRSEERR